MGTKNNPSKFDCYANAEPDEPMFILLGRDRTAPLLVELWASIREMLDDDEPEQIAEAEAIVADMRDWLTKLKKTEHLIKINIVILEK